MIEALQHYNEILHGNLYLAKHFYSNLTCIVEGNTNLIKYSFRDNNFENCSIYFLISHMTLRKNSYNNLRSNFRVSFDTSYES